MGISAEPAIRTGTDILRYRPWRGTFRGPSSAIWAIARTALGIMFRRKLFWVLYGFSLIIFLFYFYGQYLQIFIQTQLGGGPLRLGSGLTAVTVQPTDLGILLDRLNLNGTNHTFVNFIWFEGYIVTIILALAGSVVIGNDFHHRSLAFYLAKPISRWHYILGKCLAISIFISLLTMIPAWVLFLQYGLLRDDWGYYIDAIHLPIGILGYGLVLMVTLSLLLVATASWLRRTVPLIMVWTSLFVLGRVIARWLVNGLKFDESWRLIDMWNNLYLLGAWALHIPHYELDPDPQPATGAAACVVAAVCVICIVYLNRRIRAVEIIN